MKQTGYVFRAGGWWYLRYRDTILENDEPQRKQLSSKLAPVSIEDHRLKRPPKEVLDLAEQFLRPLNQNHYTPESTQNLAAFVEKVYFPYAANQKRASTLLTDRKRWEKHLKPRCGHVRLRDFRTVTGEQLIADVARQNDLARATLRQLKSFLSAVFKHAKRQGFLDGVNPVQDVSIPRAREGKETYAYSLDEIRQMLAVLPDPAKTIVAVAAFAGLRRGEIQGLSWENYDDQELRVTQSVWEGLTDEPKSKSSKAPVPVIGNLARILDHYRLSLGNPRSGVMFSASNGKPLRLNNILHSLVLPELKKAGLKWEGWHGFRRGLATVLYDLGVDDLKIQRILRHSNVAVTQQAYIKRLPRQSVEAMNTVDAKFDALTAVVQ